MNCLENFLEVDTFLQNHINTWTKQDHVKSFLQNLTEVTGCQVRMFDTASNLLLITGQPPEICTILYRQTSFCRNFHRDISGKISSAPGDRVEFFSCPIGLNYLTISVSSGERLLAYVLVGGFFIGKQKEAYSDSKLAAKLKCPSEYIKLLDRCPTWEQAEVEHHLKLARLIGRYLSICYENEVSQQAHQEWLRLVTQFQSASLTKENIQPLWAEGDTYEKIVAMACSFPNLEAGALYLVDLKEGMLKLANTQGFKPGFLPMTLPIGAGFGGWVAREGQPLVIPDINEDPRIYTSGLNQSSEKHFQLCCFPLKLRGKVSAVLYAGNRSQNALPPAEVRQLLLLARAGSLALEVLSGSKETVKQAKRWTFLKDLSYALNTSLENTNLLTLGAEMTTNLLKAEKAEFQLTKNFYHGLENCHSFRLANVRRESTPLGGLAEATLDFPLSIRENPVGFLKVSVNNFSSFSERDIETIEIICQLLGAALYGHRVTERANKTYIGTVNGLMKALERRDPYTYGHSERVGQYAGVLAERLDLGLQRVERIRLAGYVHDVGKIGIPEKVLNKPQVLQEKDLEAVHNHPVVGAQILELIPGLQELIPAVRHHHEWLNGRGYPDGLCGRNIPLEARIIAVVDVYDALISQRSHREPLSPYEALEILTLEAGHHLDEKLVTAFVQLVQEDPFLITAIKSLQIETNETVPLQETELTTREKEVLLLISEAHSNRKIAEKLYISETTVKKHITHILQKLNVTDRTKAAVYAINNGLVD